MASIKTKFTVGLFVAIGLAIAIVAIIWLGMSNYLQKGQFYSAYFDILRIRRPLPFLRGTIEVIQTF